MGHYLVSEALRTLLTVALPSICISLARTALSPAKSFPISVRFALGERPPATCLCFPEQSAFIQFSSSDLRSILKWRGTLEGFSFAFRKLSRFSRFSILDEARSLAFNQTLFTGVCFGPDLLRFTTTKPKKEGRYLESAMHLKLLGLVFYFHFKYCGLAGGLREEDALSQVNFRQPLVASLDLWQPFFTDCAAK